nr:TIM-barrel domain-containing protein [Clostridium neonatale]
MNKYGKLIDYAINDNDVKIKFEKQDVSIKIIKSDIINFFVPFFRNERNSKAVENLKKYTIKFEVEKSNDFLKIKTEKLIIDIFDNFLVNIYDIEGNILCADYKGEHKPFKRRSGDFSLAEAEGHNINSENEYKVYVSKKMEDNMYFYGLGEKTGHLNKKSYHYVNWNTDNPSPHGETFDRLYKSIPFLISIKDTTAFGIFFDNHFKTYFDMGRDNKEYYYFAADDGNLDYYFIYGPEVKKVVEGYTKLTGTVPLPQLWTLGYQQCRWSYENEERLMEIANNFRERGIPCDTLYLDIDYMDGYRVFTWDKNKFKDPSGLLKRLRDMGFKVVTIIDPGVKVDTEYNIYKEGLENGYFAKDNEGITYRNEVWPGTSVFPDFLNSNVRKWWAKNQKIMMDNGVSGIWNDMNEPASFNGPLPDDVMFDNDGIPVMHKEAHNVYAHFMDKATYEGIKCETGKRPFIVTRACYSGTQKYSTVWTGDNVSTWEHLRMSIPMLMNLGLSGFGFCGTDVGGFGHDASAELLQRWVQVGAFTPLFRNHSAMGTRDQEPWAFDELTEEINKKYIKLRYKLIPYLYDLMWSMSKNGAPVIRPLLFNYQNDKNTYEINDEFMCGDNILVAPVVEQGKKARMVYLPYGDNWIDYWTKEEFEGGSYIIKETPIDVCPIYVKAGAVIATSEEQNYIGEKVYEKMIFEVFLGSKESKSKYYHYLDDGESFKYQIGEYNAYKIKVSVDDNVEIKVKTLEKGYNDKLREMEFRIHNLNNKKVIINGQNKKISDNNIITINL